MTSKWDIDEIKIDFLHDKINYSRTSHRGKNELIAKALGLGKGITTVLDLTCGLAQDAFFMAQLGFTVRAFERSQPVFQIVAAALAKAQKDAPDRADIHRLQIEAKDSIEYLESSEFQGLSKEGMALYLDPMFPEKKKTALPRKEMQIFREVVGEDSDGTRLLSLALLSGCARVVVKRPLRSPALTEGWLHQYAGTTVRYDLYRG
jgi:16S rRNA (guanine1516-N2)-methyltransferase